MGWGDINVHEKWKKLQLQVGRGDVDVHEQWETLYGWGGVILIFMRRVARR